MEEHDTLIKKASSEIRNKLSLDFWLEELFTTGGSILKGETVKKYNPEIHEACQYVPVNIFYDESINGEDKIADTQEIRKAIKKGKAKGYILGNPYFFDLPYYDEDEEEDEWEQEHFPVLIFPVSFYKLREK